MTTRTSKNMPKLPMQVKTNFMCTDCSVEFKSKAALENHTCVLKYDPAMEVEIGESELIKPTHTIVSSSYAVDYKCINCSKAFKTLRGCNVHISHCRYGVKESEIDVKPKLESLKKKGKQYICSVCSQVCFAIYDYRKHMKTHQIPTDSPVSPPKPPLDLPTSPLKSSLDLPTSPLKRPSDFPISQLEHPLDISTSPLKHLLELPISPPKQPSGITKSSKTQHKEKNLSPSTSGKEVVLYSSTSGKEVLCPSTSDSDIEVTLNLKSMKKKEKRYVCSQCPQVCFSINEYRRHLKSCHPITARSAVVRISHPSKNKIVIPTTPINVVTTNLSSNPRHECPNCQQKFKKIGSYRRHLRSHLNIHSYQCKHCLISYLTKSQLVSHIKQLHRGEKKYHCSLCSRKFHHSIGFRKHKAEHLSSPPYQCFKCNAVFPSVSKQVIHITNHTVSCTFCRKPFANEEELWKHTSAEHEEDKEDADFLSDASECDESDSSDELNGNFNEVDVESDADSYTSIDSDRDDGLPEEESFYSLGRSGHHVKGHVCFICERRFAKQHSLDLHMKSHKIHSCMACPKFFADLSELKAHQQEHLQNNSFFYSKAFNDLQLTLPQQSSSTLDVVPASTGAQGITTEPHVTLKDSCCSELASKESIDFIAWYAGFEKIANGLSYPISHDLYQDINQIIADLASTLYNTNQMSQETKNSYIKIYNELTAFIAKNAQYIFS